MSKSDLAEAAYEGDLARLAELIARRAPLDGTDGGVFRDQATGCVTGMPYYVPLSEAARAGQADAVRALLAAGAELDGIQYRGETALMLAAHVGEATCVDVLLAAGADPNRIGCFGNALAYVQPGPQAAAIAKALLARGARLDLADEFGKRAIDRLLPDAREKLSKKDAAHRIDLLRVLEPHAPADVGPVLAKLEGSHGKSVKREQSETARFTQLGSAAAVRKADWAQQVRAQLGALSSEAQRRKVELVCKHVLSSPTAIQHASWPALVEEVVALSRSYGDATEASYGERLSLDQLEDDEGGAMSYLADEHLYTWDWVLDALATPSAIAHPRWADLVSRLCEHKANAVGYYSFGDEQIAALIARPDAQAHPRIADVIAAARRAFPFASIAAAATPATPARSKPKRAAAKAKPTKSPKAKPRRA